MTTNPFNQPTITIQVFDAPHGALIDPPIAAVDADSLPPDRRLDVSQALRLEVNGWAIPGDEATYSGPWRACTPNKTIFVDVSVNAPGGSLYVESSADGISRADAVSPGNVPVGSTLCLAFSTSLGFYRVALAPASPCRVLLRSQQRP